jgi:hypothetical protein
VRSIFWQYMKNIFTEYSMGELHERREEQEADCP